MDFQDLLSRANLTVDELKVQLPLEYLVTREGVILERQPDGKLTGLCPFHDDGTPSFALFGERLEKCGCWSCDFKQGDHFDFIGRLRGLSFPEAVKFCVEVLAEFKQDTNWTPSPPPAAVEVPVERMAEVSRRAYLNAESDLGAIHRLVAGKGLRMPASWLHTEFYLGTLDEDTVVIPHLREGTVTGYKTRVGTHHAYAAAGSQLAELYGAWRDRNQDKVILCEGESDTWTCAWQFPDHDVFGLPAGANAVPRQEWVKRLAGRDVTIIFDADPVGRSAARRWWSALEDVCEVVKIAGLEDGTDASSCADLVAAIEQALSVPLNNGLVQAANGRYERTSNGNPLSNWEIIPERLVLKDGGWYAVEGKMPDGRNAVLTLRDFENETKITTWANSRGYSWYGSKRDAQSVLELLQHEGPFLARGKSTHLAGFHEGHFVVPGTTIGPQHWVYVPPMADAELHSKIRLHAGPWDADLIWTMLRLHEPSVISPILAWMAAAPLRSMCKFFPPLAVVGGAGYGKSVLVEEILKTFGWATGSSLTDTTPYAVYALVGASNGVPIWFDEYRPGARADAKEALDQALRAAWDGGSAVKGGLQSNLQALTFLPASAPIVVSGEDAFTETSHIERLAIVPLPPVGKSAEALDKLRNSTRTGFGHDYVSWLVAQHWAGSIPAVTAGESTRPRTVRAVLDWGWQLLRGFTQDRFNMDLPELDLTRVRRESEDATPPILDAVAWGLDQYDRQMRPLAWFGQGDKLVYVRTRELISLIRREKIMVMPGGERAVTQWLQDRYGGEHQRTAHGRALVFATPKELVELLDGVLHPGMVPHSVQNGNGGGS